MQTSRRPYSKFNATEGMLTKGPFAATAIVVRTKSSPCAHKSNPTQHHTGKTLQLRAATAGVAVSAWNPHMSSVMRMPVILSATYNRNLKKSIGGIPLRKTGLLWRNRSPPSLDLPRRRVEGEKS